MANLYADMAEAIRKGVYINVLGSLGVEEPLLGMFDVMIKHGCPTSAVDAAIQYVSEWHSNSTRGGNL